MNALSSQHDAATTHEPAQGAAVEGVGEWEKRLTE